MKNILLIACLGILTTGLTGCRSDTQPVATPDSTLYDYFPSLTAPDTLHIGIDTDTTRGQWANLPLPDSMLQAALDSAQLANLIDDPSDPDVVYTAGYRFPLNQRYDACLVEALRVWFRFKGALVYDKQEKQFVASYQLAQFYGGESGQDWLESWLFDSDGDGRRDWLSHLSQHWLQMTGDDVAEHRWDTFELRLWREDGQFLAAPLSLDSAQLSARFPIEW